MTVLQSNNLVSSQGNGVTTIFPYTFRMPDISYVRVALQDRTTQIVTLLSPSVYTITGVSPTGIGGNVTYPLVGSPIDANTNILISRIVPYTQDLDITNQDGFYPETLEQELDLVVMQIQQLAEASNRAVLTPEGSSRLTIVPGTAGSVLVYGANGIIQEGNVVDLGGAVIGVNVQAWSSVLDIIAANGTPGVAGLANLLAPSYVNVFATPVDATVTDAKLAVALANSMITVCASAAAAKAVNTTRYTMLFRKSATAGASGLFGWRTGDYTARIAADTTEAIFFKADAIAASAGAWVRVDGGWAVGQFDPQWFGAVPDWNGTTGTDNALAFNSIYAMRTIFPLMNINIGAGAYRFASRLTWVFTSGQHCTITGSGWDVTQLVWNIASGGLALSYEGDVRQNGSSLKISDFAMITNQAPASAGTALQIINTPFLEGMTQPGPVITNVFARGLDSTFGWGKGFDFFDCCSTKFTNCWALGKASDYTMVAFDIRGGATDRWSDHTLDGCRVYWYSKAVQIANLAEGVVIDKCLFVAGRVGVDDVGEADRPLHLSVTNTHINADTACVRSFTGGANLIISGNLFYEWQNNTGDWAAVSVADYVEVDVHHNHITAWPLTRTKVGIQLGNVTRGRVKDNTIRGVTDPITTGIVVTGTGVIVKDNLYSNCTTRNNVAVGVGNYSCAGQAIATANSATITSVGEKVVSVNHNLGVVPTREWFTVELVSGSCVPLAGRVGSRSSTITDLVVYVPSWTSNAVVKVTLFSEIG